MDKEEKVKEITTKGNLLTCWLMPQVKTLICISLILVLYGNKGEKCGEERERRDPCGALSLSLSSMGMRRRSDGIMYSRPIAGRTELTLAFDLVSSSSKTSSKGWRQHRVSQKSFPMPNG